ncbi:hypothetical protein Tco_0817407 [Tanacetum coccineum]
MIKDVITEIMMEPTLEEYVNKTQGDYYSGITKIMIIGKAAYELKGNFLDNLQNNAFSRTNREDAVEHVENFLKIVDPLDLPNVSYERLRLAIFPISLTGDAREWLMNKPQSLVTTWVGKWDSTNVVFENWLASKFTNHMMMDPFTKNSLWDYWKKVNDQEVLTNEVFFDPVETYKDKEHEVAEIFRIKNDIFEFETPLCTTFNEFNYLKIDTYLFTHDTQGAKTYKEYENKLNDDPEEPWSENGVPYELIDHICEPFHFKNGKTKWPTCSSNEDGFCNEGELPGMVRHDYELLVKLEEYWWKMNNHECSPFTNWRNHIRGTYANTNIDANYNPYLDVSRTFNNHARKNDEEAIREERNPNDDHGKFDNNLVQDNVPYHVSEEEEQYKKERCELLGNPRQEPPVCKIGRFEVINYSVGPAEKYIAIKECEHDDQTRTEEDACHTYQEIFRIMDEGWFVTRAE